MGERDEEHAGAETGTPGELDIGMSSYAILRNEAIWERSEPVFLRNEANFFEGQAARRVGDRRSERFVSISVHSWFPLA